MFLNMEQADYDEIDFRTFSDFHVISEPISLMHCEHAF